MLSNYRNYWISDSSFSTKLEISWWKNQLLKYFLFIKKSIQNVSFGCWKDPDAGKDWRQKKGTTVDEMVGWHHWPNGHEFEQTPGVGDGQGGLAYCSPWGHKESDRTEQLNLNLNMAPSQSSRIHILFNWNSIGYLITWLQ